MNNLTLAEVKIKSVNLIPVSGTKFNSEKRIEELRRLVTDFILLGKKKGRPVLTRTEVSDAA